MPARERTAEAVRSRRRSRARDYPSRLSSWHDLRPGLLGPLASAVRAQQVSAEDLVLASLARISGASELNAVTALRPDDALEEARALDEVVRGGSEQPLAGLPLLVKDTQDAVGLRTTHGSLLLRNAVAATRSALVPRRLTRSGAIIVGKTNVSEFAFEAFSANRLFGATRNPWALAWSPGGSSGGSAAALAAGLAPLATATDGGGSVRIPASACGLAGLKPTQGVVGRDPIPRWPDLSTDGLLASTIADIRLLLSLEAGPTDGDPTAQVGWRLGSLHLPRRAFAAQRVVDYGPLDRATASLFDQALTVVEHVLGIPVEPLAAPAVFRSGDPDLDFFLIAGFELLDDLGRATVEGALGEEAFDPAFATWIRQALEISVDAYLAARRRRFAYVLELDERLGEGSVLLTPTVTVGGWTPEGVLSDREIEPAALPADVANTAAFNLAGSAALSVPLGRYPNGIPFGLQIVGPRYREDIVLGLGAALETARPWPLVAEGYVPFDVATLTSGSYVRGASAHGRRRLHRPEGVRGTAQ